MATKAEKLAKAARARALLDSLDVDQPSGDNPAPKRDAGAPDPVRASVGKQPVPAGKRPAPDAVRGGDKKRGELKRNAIADGSDSRAVPGEVRAAEPEVPEVPADKFGNKGGVIPRFIVPAVDPKLYPKIEAGTIKRGDSVWYRGDRFWVEFIPMDWSKGCYARICNTRVLPDPKMPTPSQSAELRDQGSKDLLSFCVYAGALSLAPVAKSIMDKDPTKAAIARKERSDKGLRDVGDEVATKLRGCKDLAEVYVVASRYLEEPVAVLKKKYEHLNPGQQRMNLGNRMRNQWKRENGNG